METALSYKYRPYVAVLCLMVGLILLWNVNSPQTSPRLMDYGMVKFKIHELSKGTKEWKNVLFVQCASGYFWKCYTSREVYNKYGHGDSIYFHWPQKFTRY